MDQVTRGGKRADNEALKMRQNRDSSRVLAALP